MSLFLDRTLIMLTSKSNGQQKHQISTNVSPIARVNIKPPKSNQTIYLMKSTLPIEQTQYNNSKYLRPDSFLFDI